MQTPLSPDNPHGPGRHGFAWEHVPGASAAHLDFGCGNGAFLASLRPKGIRRLAGVDASSEAVARAHERFPDLDIHRVGPGEALPFEDRAFASITMLDVLEHVYEQSQTLRDLVRVLADGGPLVVTVPQRYLFSCLDAGNLKFRFPRLHHRLFRLRHSEEEYVCRYASNPDGLIGDVSARKAWHEHFSPAGLAELLGSVGLQPMVWDGSGFFLRPLAPLVAALGAVPGLRRAGRAIERSDARAFRSMNLFCVARKKG